MDIIFEKKNKQDQATQNAGLTLVKFAGDVTCEFSSDLPYIYGNSH